MHAVSRMYGRKMTIEGQPEARLFRCVDTLDSVTDESGMPLETAAGAKVSGGGGGKLKARGPGRPVWKVGDLEVQRWHGSGESVAYVPTP